MHSWRPSCRVDACGRFVRSHFSHWCERHRQSLRRHGHAEQKRVPKGELVPYVREVRRVLRGRETTRLVNYLNNLRACLLDHAVDASGSRNRWTRLAANEIGRALEQTDILDCTVTLAAVWLLAERQPRRFVNRRSFEFVLVRHFRAHAETAWGSYWDDRQSRPKKVYRDLRPIVIEHMAAVLVESFSPLVSRILRTVNETHQSDEW